jgi:hypothetical protein
VSASKPVCVEGFPGMPASTMLGIALRTIGHGVDARGTGQVPGAVIGRQDSPAHGEGSVRNRGSDLRIVGWKFWLGTAKSFGMMVAREGVEPPTPAFSEWR